MYAYDMKTGKFMHPMKYMLHCMNFTYVVNGVARVHLTKEEIELL